MSNLRQAAETTLFRLLGDENHDIQLRAAIALLQALDLQTTIERGTKAWADVPNATEWVEELRGNANEWVGLTEEDFYKKDDETVFVLGMKFAEARLKEKNT